MICKVRVVDRIPEFRQRWFASRRSKSVRQRRLRLEAELRSAERREMAFNIVGGILFFIFAVLILRLLP
jgi:hypothetical protein